MNGPCNLSRVLALQKERFTLRRAKAKDLKEICCRLTNALDKRQRLGTNFAIATNEQATFAWIYLVICERVDFEFL